MFSITAVLISALYLGKTKKVPLTGWRFKAAKRLMVWAGTWEIIFHGREVVWRKYTVDEVDYSKYLGPDWKEKQFKGKRVSTICGNHYSNLDHMILLVNPWMRQISPRWTPAEFCKAVPFMHAFTSCFQGVFITRTGDSGSMKAQVDNLSRAQKEAENSEADFAPLCIFPEACCSNGLYLSKFRRGAFVAEVAIQPWLSRDEWTVVANSYDALLTKTQLILEFSLMHWSTTRADLFPIF